MTKNERLYLAYGSNMDTEQMAFRCPDAHLLGASVKWPGFLDSRS